MPSDTEQTSTSCVSGGTYSAEPKKDRGCCDGMYFATTQDLIQRLTGLESCLEKVARQECVEQCGERSESPELQDGE